MSDASKSACKGSEGSFDVIHSAACGSNDRVLGSPPRGALDSNPLGIRVNEILRENKSCVNECPGIKLPWEVGVMAEIFSSKPLDALPKVPASSLEPQSSEAQDLDQAKGSFKAFGGRSVWLCGHHWPGTAPLAFRAF